ncbi:hypothetical protein QWJ34_16945 [Saccharibacillus sp. CPCC 101409]|uniref:hypothetical protein n=1 Tax=Saccharibacillus sp. CPCC 101409 TaxID=3058041 RepID=UPI0026736D51|nr:hypothetical protein [Saccharibacillus sp. CPCC 101409]MDO3411456.1 hypothetical protein [Saccharibacillus sp. CPCC 101409]
MNFLQRIKGGAERASGRAQSAVEIGRLNSHISEIQREIEVHHLRMGQVFYENYRNRDTAPAEEEIMELCTVCDLLSEEVAELRQKIVALRRQEEQLLQAPQPQPAAAEPKSEASVSLDKTEEAGSGQTRRERPDKTIVEPELEPVESRAEVGEDADAENYAEAEEYENYEKSELREENAREAERGRGGERFDQRSEERVELHADERLVVGPERGGETEETLEERQRSELRAIRAEERRKMKEAEQAQMRSESEDYEPEPEAGPEEEPEPPRDPEYDRRQREREEREQERQDELDRLIASWNRGVDPVGEEPVYAPEREERGPRRPVGEVIRCQVCGSGLSKGSKWCPHCGSEQV